MVALLSIVVVFVGDVLVAAERVRIGKILVELDGPTEEFERRFVLFLKTVAVSDHTPGFWSEKRFLESLVAEEN